MVGSGCACGHGKEQDVGIDHRRAWACPPRTPRSHVLRPFAQAPLYQKSAIHVQTISLFHSIQNKKTFLTR
jgi:hypothetical protein